MNITKVEITPAPYEDPKFMGYANIVIDDDFIIKDIKIIKSLKGYFIAMPSREKTDRCPECSAHNSLRNMFCGACGVQLPEINEEINSRNSRLYQDVAHPINPATREQIESMVIESYFQKIKISQTPTTRQSA